ncbi:MAG: M23 family peptidase, partial [Pseudomonadota bacterium]|nr:M23 family peptidase [Pseudomonadota bacterium]
MRWLLTFLAGVLIGAGGLFVFLRQVPHDVAPAPTVVVAPTTVTAPAASPTDTLNASLPPAPVVPT